MLFCAFVRRARLKRQRTCISILLRPKPHYLGAPMSLSIYSPMSQEMAGANSQVGGHDSKRRKVRKGTQSCWECRRRKVRCIFAATTDAICKNCKRRGTACNSQEHPDEPILSVGSNQVEARLGRVEQLIEHLVDNNIPNSNSQGKQLSCTDIPTPVESEAAPGDSLGCSDRNTVVRVSCR
jgi:hypothetical protein